jgi:hypothetical protein
VNRDAVVKSWGRLLSGKFSQCICFFVAVHCVVARYPLNHETVFLCGKLLRDAGESQRGLLSRSWLQRRNSLNRCLVVRKDPHGAPPFSWVGCGPVLIVLGGFLDAHQLRIVDLGIAAQGNRDLLVVPLNKYACAN